MRALYVLLVLVFIEVAQGLVFPDGWELLAAQDDYDVVKYPQSGDPGSGFVNFSFSGTVKSTGRNYTIFIGTLSKGLPDSFGFELPKGGKYSSDVCIHATLL